MDTFSALSIAGSVIALRQFSIDLLSKTDQSCDIAPCEITSGLQSDLVALSDILEDVKNLDIPENTEEIQGHSRCLSVGIHEELQKLTRESHMVLKSLSRLMYEKQDAIRRYPRLFASERRAIGEITLRWKTVLSVIRTTHLPSRKDMKEFDNRNITKHLRYALKGSENNIESSSTSTRSGIDSEKTNEYRNDTIAIVGMTCRFPDHTGNPVDLWDMLVNGHRSSNPGNDQQSRIERRWDPIQGFCDSRDGSRWCQGDRYSWLNDYSGAQRLGIVTGIGTTKANHGSGDQGNFCLTDPAYLTSLRDEGRSYIGSSQTLPSNWKCYKCPFKFAGTDIGYVLAKEVQTNELEPTDPELTHRCRVRPALGLATAMPVALISGASAFCMYSYAANRHGWRTVHPVERLFFIAAINNPSPPWLVAATLVHGIATLFYYYLRPSDRFREIFVGAGIVTASAVGLWRGFDVEGLLLGVLPIVITASLLLCTITNVAAEGFKSGSHLQQSREPDLEKEAGI